MCVRGELQRGFPGKLFAYAIVRPDLHKSVANLDNSHSIALRCAGHCATKEEEEEERAPHRRDEVWDSSIYRSGRHWSLEVREY